MRERKGVRSLPRIYILRFVRRRKGREAGLRIRGTRQVTLQC